MIAWLRRVFSRRRDKGDPVYDATLAEHARVMAHAERAVPGDPVIREAKQQADSWMRRQYAERMAGHR